MKIAEIKFLEEEPKKPNRLQMFAYNFTRPLASILDLFNFDKIVTLYYRRKYIAEMNRIDFIDTVSKLIYDDVTSRGISPIFEPLCRILCVQEAKKIFEEKKQNGGFDELNIIK